MLEIFTRNLSWKLLSVGIAFLLWISVAREPEVATSLSVPVDFKNMSDNLDITGNLPDRVRLELRGPSGRLTRDNLSAVAVVLDLSDAKPGERTYSIRGRNLNLPVGVMFYRAVPSQLTLHFAELLTKEVPVEPVYTFKPAGFRVTTVSVSPATVRIRGSEDRVAYITAVHTDPVQLSNLPSQVLHTHVNIGDPQVRIVQAPTDITVRVNLQQIGNGSVQ